MGWFWSDVPARSHYPPAPHPIPASNASPPPGCPMHSPDQPPSSFPPQHDTATKSQSSCPVKSPNHPILSAAPSSAATEPTKETPSNSRSSYNPLNFMFSALSNKRSADQTAELPLEREVSSIPRGDAESNWEYPSPQQMYNAMLRKGYTDTPIDAVESMVAVHNFLNEGAWQEIVSWERIFGKGLKEGWKKCRMGEQNMAFAQARAELRGQQDEDQPKLLRFEGRPKEMTPKAVMWQVLGTLYPQKFGTEPPFDRHDWYIQRLTPEGPKQIRYVIDYYSGEPEPTGEPVFYLDIRPAIDTPTAAAERVMRWGGDFWYRASGAAAREAEAERKAASRRSSS